MNDIPIRDFVTAIRAVHRAEARYLGSELVEERFEGEPVWTGEVLVFELLGHPTATRCYAWEVDGEVTAVLHEPPVDSAAAAVRASIMADERAPRA